MVVIDHAFLCFLNFSFLSSLFFPWVLTPNVQTYNIDPISGFQFFLQNLPGLGLVILIFITHFLFLKDQSRNLFFLLEVELLLLTIWLVYPFFFWGMDYFTGIRIGYIIALGILIIWNIYNSIHLFKRP
ncbi:hypothetical protein [Jeotgalibaca caeni]|uniref:hypothetical protein n=1 Tax=Jeotgalibaca caeni TaxID=3028623 RepID=UPI00237E31E4|nr:hypothetical protein [Jeotgalibaca caeni]MDE1549414.1 hypothetical protein [Jeotgalibaca caeni]